MVAQFKLVVRRFYSTYRKPAHQHVVDGRRNFHASAPVGVESTERTVVRRHEPGLQKRPVLTRIVDIEIAGNDNPLPSGHRLDKFGDLPRPFFA